MLKKISFPFTTSIWNNEKKDCIGKGLIKFCSFENFLTIFPSFNFVLQFFRFFQLGIAVGFLVPPMLVKNHDDIALIGRDLQFMFYLIAGYTSVLVILVVLCKLSQIFSLFDVKHFSFLFSFPKSTTNSAECCSRSIKKSWTVIAILTFLETFGHKRKLHSIIDLIWHECRSILCHFNIVESSENSKF